MSHYRRQYLPHFDYGEYQIITYRLNDALPQSMLANIRQYEDAQIRKKLTEQILDKHYGSCILRRPEIAKIIVENWLYFNGKLYDLMAYVVMPNHVHVLIRVYPQQKLGDIVHKWKSYSAKMIAQILPDYPKIVWQKNYWDRYIRDAEHFEKAWLYIENNPVKAGLVNTSSEWQFSSRFQIAADTKFFEYENNVMSDL